MMKQDWDEEHIDGQTAPIFKIKCPSCGSTDPEMVMDDTDETRLELKDFFRGQILREMICCSCAAAWTACVNITREDTVIIKWEDGDYESIVNWNTDMDKDKEEEKK